MKKSICTQCLGDGKLIEMKKKGKTLVCNRCGNVLDEGLMKYVEEEK